MQLRVILVAVCAVGCAKATEESRAVDASTGSHADASSQSPGDARSDSTVSGTCPQATAGVLATYSFTSAAGNQTSTAAASSATGLVAGAVQRSSGLTAVSGAGSINSSGWPTAAQLDATKYYTFTLAPPSGCTLTLSSSAIDAKASSTGPTSAAIATSKDSYAATATVSTSVPSTPTLGVSGATGTIEVRVYGWAASSTSGTFRLQNTLTISGSLQ